MWEDRRDWEVGLRYGVRMNHIITLKSIVMSFFTYIISLYIYLDAAYSVFILNSNILAPFIFTSVEGEQGYEPSNYLYNQREKYK